MLVGDFQQLAPVGDSLLYEEIGDGNILFEYIEYLVHIIEPHRHCQEEYDNDSTQRNFQRCLINCQHGNLDLQDWGTSQ